MRNEKLIPYEFQNIVIISGGQTGADQGALEGAHQAGFVTGGFIPKGFKTEKGPMPELKDKFRMIEASSVDYIFRTHLNAKSSSMTIWFGSEDNLGFAATKNACNKYGKPFYDVDHCGEDDIIKLIKQHRPTVINVAGTRESKSPGIQEKVKNIIYNVLNKLK